MNWKIARDSYYRELYPFLAGTGVIDAGFFYDESTYDVDLSKTLNIHCNPMQGLIARNKKAIAEKRKRAIILATGSFNPVHDGHVDMMVNAKEALEKLGYVVLAGFLAPDHGAYIEKKLGSEAISIQDRAELIRKATIDHDWLEVDSWPGIFHHTSINFTDVIERMKLYLKKNLKIEVPIFFVCGGDNARFAKTFAIKGHCIIVNRRGFEDRLVKVRIECQAIARKFKTTIEGRILATIGENENSSTKVRKNWKLELKQKELFLRIDKNQAEVEKPFIDIISKYFEKINFLDIQQQIKDFVENKYEPERTISLDPFIISNYNFGISRMYDFFGTKRGSQDFCRRPGTAPIMQQLDLIPDGSYVLFDDDICSGSTMKVATEQFEMNGIKILSQISFTRSDEDHEVLDIRDFMYKSEKGGLVIQGFGIIPKRYPYIYPFVCPHTRASIHQPIQFSIDIWYANYEYWKKQQRPYNALQCLYYATFLTTFL